MQLFINKEKSFFSILVVLGVLVLVMAGSASAQKVRLRSQITPACTSVSGANLKFADIFGDGNIAVQGSYGCRGAFIYDISNPDAPVLASWYNPGNNQQFLEAVVVGNRAYFGSGLGGGGVHIVDVSNPYSPVLLGVVDSTHGNGHNFIHEMVVWGNYLIENYNSLSTTKILKIINISNPANPVFVRDLNPTEVQWVHAMVVRGNRLYTSGWGNGANRAKTEIYDITNIETQAPTLLGAITDPTSVTGGNSMHSAWPSEDGNYLYSCRETSNGSGDVRVYDIHNPAAPVLVNSVGMNALGLNAVTPHNPVVAGNYLYVAWYQAGLQVFDISNPAVPKRVGQYDTFQQAFAPETAAKQSGRTGSEEEPWDVICASSNSQNALPTSYDGNWAVYPFLGPSKILTGDLKNGLQVLDVSQVAAPLKNTVSDFDGDGKTDVSVYNQSTGDWLLETSSNNISTPIDWGTNGDMMEAGDYDGDGKSDVAVFRPSEGNWYILGSTAGFMATHFGQAGDVPVAADYDADGKADVAVWRPSNGVWYVMQSTLGFYAFQWGTNGDKAFSGDYEGDGKSDLIIWRPSNGYWYILQSSSSIPVYSPFGLSNVDKPLTGDYDGDGRMDLSVYRPTTGYWYIQNSSNGAVAAYKFGIAEDIPVPADYDGDSKADVTVFRPSENAWYRLNSSNGAFVAEVYGQTGFNPSPSSVQPQ
jgi:hypothetical protein